MPKRASTVALLIFLAGPLVGQEFFPIDRVKAGMKATGRTVFAGEKIEEFQAEILGVLENVGPRQSIILARLSGGPLAKTGVPAGMSGSPVYLEGKLLGAVALGFAFATEPIAGIRPAVEMVTTFEQRADPLPATLRASVAADRWIPADAARLLPPAPERLATQPPLTPIATPVHFAGFTARTLDVFGPALRELGLAPMQGAGGASRSASSRLGDPATLAPGSMISVGLIRGDLAVQADGALTHIDGRRVYAFGHRFLSSGPTEMPFMKASVITLLPNLNQSFKISSAGELMGTIRQDRTSGIYGEVGARPRMIPVQVNLHSSRSGNQQYNLEMVNDRFLSPFLLQMAVFSTIDATERGLGASTFRVRGQIRFGTAAAPVELDNIYAGEANIANNVAVGAALPMAHLLQSGFPELRVEGVRLDIASLDEKKQLRLERAWASPAEVRPGERIELAATLRGDSGREVIRKVPFDIPQGTAPGNLSVTFADGQWMNLLDLQAPGLTRDASSGPQLVRAINRLRKNSSLYVRVWKPDRGFALPNEPLPSPPASLRSVLANSGGITNTWTAILAEIEIDAGEAAVSGSATIRLTVKD